MKDRTDAREVFRRNLVRLMDERGISQTDIAEKLKVSSATASDWYNGVKYPRVDAMQALADLLGVLMKDLVSEEQDASQNGDLTALREQLRRQPGMRILFDASKGATEQDLLDAAALIEGFKKRRDGEE